MEPKWLTERRQKAAEDFKTLPLPKTDEFWRRTNLSRIPFDQFEPIQSVTNGAAKGSASRYLPVPMMVSGELLYGEKMSPATLDPNSQKAGVILDGLQNALEKYPELVLKYFGKGFQNRHEKFLAQNEAFWQTGVFCYIPKNTQVELPILLASHFSGGNQSAAPRLLIVLDKGAKTTIVHYASSETENDSIFLNNVVEIYIEEEAHLTYIDSQALSDQTFEIAQKRIELETNAKLKWVLDIQGSKLSKTNIETVLKGSGAAAEVLGLLCGNKKQHLELYAWTQHAAPHTTADILIKGTANDAAKTIFQGMIRIEKAAQGTESYMANNNLVLSEKAHADSIPRLEIEADDVRASHGATIGQVDAEQLFYLETRGLNREEAEHLIVEGFYEDIFGRIPVESVREVMRKNIEKKVGVIA